jgi:TetR/AcrR family fatty acid metabolism transcriptional regulator
MEAKAGEKTKRELILEAAMVVFARDGFHVAKVEDIANEAGVGKGTVYEYFSSKLELFQEMFKEGMGGFIQSLHTEINNTMTTPEKLRKVAYLHFQFIMKHRDLAKLSMENQQCGEDFRKWIFSAQRQKLEYIGSIIEEGIAKGELRKVDSNAAAMVFSGAMGALFVPVSFGNVEVEPKDIIEPILNVIFEGIVK